MFSQRSLSAQGIHECKNDPIENNFFIGVHRCSSVDNNLFALICFSLTPSHGQTKKTTAFAYGWKNKIRHR